MTNSSFFNFIGNFIKSPKQVGSLIPSSKFLASELISRSNNENKSTFIVEVGVGTGVITEKILRNLSNTNKYIGIELNSSFAKSAREKFPAVQIINDCASKINHYTFDRFEKKCDAVISSIPWANLSPQKQEEILSNIYDSIAPGGYFSTFSYLGVEKLPKGRAFFSLLNSKFDTVNVSQTIWKNFPPAKVYHCFKKDTLH